MVLWHFAVFEIDNNDNMQVTCKAFRTTRVSQNNRHGNVCQKALYVHYNKKYVQTDMTVILCNKKYTLKLTFHQINFLGKGLPVINSRLLVLISFLPKGCNKNLNTKTLFSVCQVIVRISSHFKTHGPFFSFHIVSLYFYRTWCEETI